MATIIRADGVFKYEGDVYLARLGDQGYAGIILEGNTTLARELELALRLSAPSVRGKPVKVKIVVEIAPTYKEEILGQAEELLEFLEREGGAWLPTHSDDTLRR